MNEKVDLVRRKIAAKLDAEERTILKNVSGHPKCTSKGYLKMHHL